MTAPAVDRVRNIPLIVEKMTVDGDEYNTGFPFDREDRDDSFRSQLDDIANRHPELAEHLEDFPFRSDSLGRRSRPPRPEPESEFRRFSGRPFGSGRFGRFGFPFDSFEEEFDRTEPEHNRHEPPPPPPPKPESPQTEEKKEPRGRRQNIQPSNTVDLGQKQEPVNDRNQRSMSAPPPDNRQGQQRYVSSINIPINRDGGIAEAQPQQNKPMERVIPIHVEGRDEPVMPKHSGPSFGQTQPERVFTPQPERVFGQSPQPERVFSPQPERIFGHRPERFTQFVGREQPRQFASGPEWHHPAYTSRQETPPKQEPPMRQQQAPPQQQQAPTQKPQEEVPPQPQPKPSLNNPIDLIQSIQKDVSELMGQVEKFDGAPKDKQYLYLDEMLTRNLIKLDNIDTQGQENIRQARKEAIKCIERCIGILEAKAAQNVANKQPPEEAKMEVESTKEEEKSQTDEKPAESQTTENMDVEVNKDETKVEEKTEAVVKKEPKVEQSSEEKMEVAAAEEPKVEEEKVEEQKPEEVTTQEATSQDGEKKEVGK